MPRRAGQGASGQDPRIDIMLSVWIVAPTKSINLQQGLYRALQHMWGGVGQFLTVCDNDN